jgi:hypothetical protein
MIEAPSERHVYRNVLSQNGGSSIGAAHWVPFLRNSKRFASFRSYTVLNGANKALRSKNWGLACNLAILATAYLILSLDALIVGVKSSLDEVLHCFAFPDLAAGDVVAWVEVLWWGCRGHRGGVTGAGSRRFTSG